MVVCLDLDAHGMVVIKLDDPSIVNEHGEGPVESFFDEFEGGCGDGGFEEVVDGVGSVAVHGDAGARIGGDIRSAVAGIVDDGFECLVDAVLGPCLCEGFELDIGGVSAEGLVVILDGLHFIEVEEEMSFA